MKDIYFDTLVWQEKEAVRLFIEEAEKKGTL